MFLAIRMIGQELGNDTGGGRFLETLPVGGRKDRLEPLVDVAFERVSDG